MKYEIAIPTYKRYSIVKDKSIATLLRHGASPADITIFVANESEKELYAKSLGDEFKIVVGVIGISNQRKFISAYYPAGTPIVSIDDDIISLKQKNGEKMEECKMSIDELAGVGFKVCERSRAKLWGIYPVANGFFLKDKATVGLRYIAGGLYGSYAGDPVFVGKRSLESSGEDFENSILSFKKYGCVVRIDWVCFTTKCFAGGGIDAELKDKGIPNRMTDHAKCLYEIEARHPELSTTYIKAGDVVNIRLKHITYEEVDRADLTNK